mgnify:CR=1 FL=1
MNTMKDAMAPESCPVCADESGVVLRYVVRDQFPAQLRQCHGCGFAWVMDPAWLESSFGAEQHNLDLGAVDRCSVVLDFVEVLVRREKISTGTFVDWGGGYGLMTRMARDRGLDFRNLDPYVKELFAGPAQLKTMVSADLVVASEVFLHLLDPVASLAELIASGRRVLVTAVVLNGVPDKDWWYLMPSTGQHVAFFTLGSLREMARRTGSTLVTDGRFFHVFSREKMRFSSRAVVRWRSLAYSLAMLNHLRFVALRALGRNPSRTPGDQQMMMQSDGGPRD